MSGIVIFLAFLALNQAHAQQDQPPSHEQFATNYTVQYTLAQNGEAQVDQDIQIVNKQRDVIATNYALTVRHMVIYDVSAVSEKGDKLETTVVEEGDKTTIAVEFEDTIIGEGKENNFTINYKTKDIASKVGEVWNVNIPRVNLLDTTEAYNAKIHVPLEYGPEIFVSPEPPIREESSTAVTYGFDKETLAKTGITASFGSFQVLNFMLDYHLKNDTHFTQTREIALPPDIPDVQQVVYSALDPQPTMLKQDVDGNTIAVYELRGDEELLIKLMGTARILGKQINPELGLSKVQISDKLISQYTRGNNYWQVTNPKIQEIAQKLYDPAKSAAQNAQSAYNFVVTNLEYDFEILDNETVERKGAVSALDSKENIGCMEFTDLFISLVRAMGIPARELNGYAIANDNGASQPLSINLKGGDLLHSWAEFYDEEFGWVPVDPTWESTSGIDYFTKLDTNHLVFVIKGIDPQFPLPAGAYKFSDKQKQVDVTFAQNSNLEDFEPKLAFYNTPNTNVLSYIKKHQKFALKNESDNTVYAQINKRDVPLLPGNHIAVYVPQEKTVVYVKDATGKNYEIEPEIKNAYIESPLPTYLALAVSMLVLCTILYFGVKFLRGPRKPISRLRHRLRGLNQLSNRRS